MTSAIHNSNAIVKITEVQAKYIPPPDRFFQLPPFYWEDFLDYDGSWANTNSVREMKQHARERREGKNQLWKQVSMSESISQKGQ